MRSLKNLFKFREKSQGDTIKPFLEHMEDLRWTIIRMVVTQATMTILAFCYRGALMELLKVPLLELHPVPKLMTTGIADSFIIAMELSFFAGLALAFPFHVYFGTSFILPALTRKERGHLLPGIVAGFLFFLAGVYMAYSAILPTTLQFFWKDAIGYDLNPQWTWRAYFSFSTWLCFGFGALCEVPVIVVVLAMLGVVKFRTLRRTRPYAYTIIMVLSAVVAPTPDPMMLLTMAMPILAMYEACIWVAWLLDRRERRSGRTRQAGTDSLLLLPLLVFLHRFAPQQRR